MTTDESARRVRFAERTGLVVFVAALVAQPLGILPVPAMVVTFGIACAAFASAIILRERWIERLFGD